MLEGLPRCIRIWWHGRVIDVDTEVLVQKIRFSEWFEGTNLAGWLE